MLKKTPGHQDQLDARGLSDALLVLYQTETFRAEKTGEIIYQFQLSIIFCQELSKHIHGNQFSY